MKRQLEPTTTHESVFLLPSMPLDIIRKIIECLGGDVVNLLRTNKRLYKFDLGIHYVVERCRELLFKLPRKCNSRTNKTCSISLMLPKFKPTVGSFIMVYHDAVENGAESTTLLHGWRGRAFDDHVSKVCCEHCKGITLGTWNLGSFVFNLPTGSYLQKILDKFLQFKQQHKGYKSKENRRKVRRKIKMFAKRFHLRAISMWLRKLISLKYDKVQNLLKGVVPTE